MSIRNLVLAIILCLSVVIPNFAQARVHGGDGFGQMQAYRVVFNEDQNKKMDAIIDSVKKEVRPFIQDLIKQKQDLRAMIKDESIGDSALKAQVMKTAEIQSQLVIKRAATIRSIRKIATPDQLAKVDAYTADQQKKHAKWMEKMSQLWMEDGAKK